MAEEHLKAGDVVKLKSGGPKMTVVTADGHGNFVVAWFVLNDASKLHTETVAGAALERWTAKE